MSRVSLRLARGGVYLAYESARLRGSAPTTSRAFRLRVWPYPSLFSHRLLPPSRGRKRKRTSEDCLLLFCDSLPNLFLRLFYTLTQLLALIFGWASFGSSPGVGKGHKEQPSSPQQVLTLTDRTLAGVIATSNDQIMQFHDEKVHKIYGPTFSMAFPARNEALMRNRTF